MTQAHYDELAEWYDEQVRTTLVPFHALAISALLDLAGDVRGLEVCDLACGQGILSRELAKRGANVAGVDISERLLTLARRHADAAAITYRHDDAQALTTLPDASFDLVACNLALMDIPDLPAVCAAVRRVLRPDGAFVFSITHPCTLPPASTWTTEADGGPGRHIRGYFQEGYAVPPDTPGVRGRVGTHHRTLATYLNTLTATGLQLHRLAEPRATGDAAELRPGAAEVPAFLVVRCVAS